MIGNFFYLIADLMVFQKYEIVPLKIVRKFHINKYFL